MPITSAGIDHNPRVLISTLAFSSNDCPIRSSKSARSRLVRTADGVWVKLDMLHERGSGYSVQGLNCTPIGEWWLPTVQPFPC